MRDERFAERNAEIYKLYTSGKTCREIGEQYNMSGTNVGNIIHRYEREQKRREGFGDYNKYLSYRTINLLRYRDITTKAQLLPVDAEALRNYCKGFGDIAYAEITACQQAMGKDVKLLTLREVEYVNKEAVLNAIKEAGVYILVADKIDALKTITVKERC